MKPKSQARKAELALASRSQKLAEFQRQVVSPERLAATITDHIEWRAFAYWVQLIVEAQGSVSAAMKVVLDARCPGFLEHERVSGEEGEPLWLRLISWIDERIFGFAKAEGWSHALGFYAARDTRCDQIESYWLRCADEWKCDKPEVLPTFHEWRRAAGTVSRSP